MSEIEYILNIFIEKYGKQPLPPNNDVNKFGKAKNLPKDYLEFMSLTDGFNIGAGYIYNTAKEINGENQFISINETHKKDVEKYLKDLYNGRYDINDFAIFANDGAGGYYAFSTDENDSTVYYFDNNYSDDYIVFESFLSWLRYGIDMEEAINPGIKIPKKLISKRIWLAGFILLSFGLFALINLFFWADIPWMANTFLTATLVFVPVAIICFIIALIISLTQKNNKR